MMNCGYFPFSAKTRSTIGVLQFDLFDLFYARSRTNHKGWKRQYITPDNKGILDMSIFEIEHFRIIIEFSDGSDQ
ncbi:unnamed protein product [Caenorhabditis nigoni]